jgi:hypothetical protein
MMLDALIGKVTVTNMGNGQRTFRVRPNSAEKRTRKLHENFKIPASHSFSET